MTKLDSVRHQFKQVHGRFPDESDVDDIFNEFVPLQFEAIKHHATLIPGAAETATLLRKRNLKIGSCTGFTREMMNILEPLTKKQGYAPDAIVCSNEVPAGRPDPWMIFKNMMELQIFPLESIVKIGDTIMDITEGLNANVWTIGLAKSGELKDYSC